MGPAQEEEPVAATHAVEMDGPAPQRGHGLRRQLLLGFVALLLVAAAAWAWHWRTHPTVLPGDGNTLGMTMNAGQVMFEGVTFPDPGTGEKVSIEAAAPRILENSADASFEFYVCTLDPERGAIGALRGHRAFSAYCPDAEPIEDGTELDLGSASAQQLVMLVTAERPGVVVTEGVDLTYSSGLQRGTQAIGIHLRIKSR
jgi:hypothetical protein